MPNGVAFFFHTRKPTENEMEGRFDPNLHHAIVDDGGRGMLEKLLQERARLLIALAETIQRLIKPPHPSPKEAFDEACKYCKQPIEVLDAREFIENVGYVHKNCRMGEQSLMEAIKGLPLNEKMLEDEEEDFDDPFAEQEEVPWEWKQHEQTCLEEAQGIVTGARREYYGHPLDNHGLTARLWINYTERRREVDPNWRIRPEDVCIMNILQKISRFSNVPTRDGVVDIIGYGANIDILFREHEERQAEQAAQTKKEEKE